MRIETLESRIAPAILVDATTVTFTDVDGDDVTVRIIRGSFDPGGAEFVFDSAFGTAGPQQLQKLDLSATEFAGTNVMIIAKRSAANGGDGFVNVGFIDARDNVEAIDLGAVVIDGDLGGLDAGDADATMPALKSLTAQSLGAFGTATQDGTGNLFINANGSIGKITVKGDVRSGVQVAGVAGAGLGPVSIGGSLFGGAGIQSGTLEVVGDIGAVKIGGSIFGGTGNLSGGISANGKIASVTIGGSLVGGSALQSGEVSAGGDIGPIKIGRDLRGGGGSTDAGRIESLGSIKSITIGGSVVGGLSDYAAHDSQIFAAGMLGPVSIRGDLRGSSGDGTASLSGASIAGIKVGGSFEAGSGISSGAITADGAIKSVTITGSWLRTGGGDSTIASDSGGIGSIKIGGDLISAGGIAAVRTDNAGNVGSITIGGDIRGGASGQPLFHVEGTLKSLAVKGSIVGTAALPLRIAGTADGVANGAAVVAIGKITVGGRVEFGIFAGLDPDAIMGPITVGGDFIASRIAVGTDDGADNIFGTADDTFLAGGDPTKSSLLTGLTIKGMAYGTHPTMNGADTFRVMAEKIGKIRVGGTAIPLPSGPSEVFFGPTGDLAAEDNS